MTGDLGGGCVRPCCATFSARHVAGELACVICGGCELTATLTCSECLLTICACTGLGEYVIAQAAAVTFWRGLRAMCAAEARIIGRLALRVIGLRR